MLSHDQGRCSGRFGVTGRSIPCVDRDRCQRFIEVMRDQKVLRPTYQYAIHSILRETNDRPCLYLIDPHDGTSE
jgi:hypothetical protein